MPEEKYFISVTKLKLMSIFKFFSFMKHVNQSVAQLKGAEGLVTFKLRIQNPYTYWTLTVWKDKQSMMKYRNSGAHLEAMKEMGKLARHAESAHYESSNIPDWKDAAEILQVHGSKSGYGRK